MRVDFILPLKSVFAATNSQDLASGVFGNLADSIIAVLLNHHFLVSDHNTNQQVSNAQASQKQFVTGGFSLFVQVGHSHIWILAAADVVVDRHDTWTPEPQDGQESAHQKARSQTNS